MCKNQVRSIDIAKETNRKLFFSFLLGANVKYVQTYLIYI